MIPAISECRDNKEFDCIIRGLALNETDIKAKKMAGYSLIKAIVHSFYDLEK